MASGRNVCETCGRKIEEGGHRHISDMDGEKHVFCSSECKNEYVSAKEEEEENL